MRKLATITGAFVAFILLSANQAEAQHFHRGYGPGWGGGSGFSVNIGNGPGFGHAYGRSGFHGGWNRGFQPSFYRPAPIYAAPIVTGYRYNGFNRGVGVNYGRGYRSGCRW